VTSRARVTLTAVLATGATVLPATEALAKHARDGRFSGRTDQRYHGKRGKTVFTVERNGTRLRNLEIDLLYTCPKYGQWPSKMVIRTTKIQYYSGIFLRTGNFRGRAYSGHRAKSQIRMAGRFHPHRHRPRTAARDHVGHHRPRRAGDVHGGRQLLRRAAVRLRVAGGGRRPRRQAPPPAAAPGARRCSPRRPLSDPARYADARRQRPPSPGDVGA
jgi:hypothetical protein